MMVNNGFPWSSPVLCRPLPNGSVGPIRWVVCSEELHHIDSPVLQMLRQQGILARVGGGGTLIHGSCPGIGSRNRAGLVLQTTLVMGIEMFLRNQQEFEKHQRS